MKLNVYPNPVSDVLHITSGDGIVSCELYSLAGALVASAQPDGAADVEIEVGSVANGVYMLRVVTANGAEMINKIIKK